MAPTDDDRADYHKLSTTLEEVKELLSWCQRRAIRLELPGTADEIRAAIAHVNGVVCEMDIKELPEFVRFQKKSAA